ncbi:DUF3194 domain-containing protein [Haloarcula salinisoli]|uniref:DUF3194 domain-containing protein n=1 Tax=Haloarcula salinisoli TaxID=2487746 RepID=A0A8J7YJB4_9EURY|nr:DUF3194 domain-containing protein [Halomicroarcula salinisoli]MBX0286239.1 DUF3194 domain-containing protein [Halomicroarcula salinisoli]MBX0302273.1 DUF3194 domain-containing protein [Halomicroarcula salinisoli]
MATDDEVVETAADAAEDVIFARLSVSEVEDYDVTVTFEERVLDVDIYVKAPDASADEERVADDAALAARGAVDELLTD